MLRVKRKLDAWSMLLTFGGIIGVVWYRHRKRRLEARGRQSFNARSFATALAAGATEQHRVRLWGRTNEAGVHRLELREVRQSETEQSLVYDVSLELDAGTDLTFTLDYPSEFSGARALKPNTAYHCRLSAPSGGLIGTARFETSPVDFAETPECFALAAVSCHLPFDDRGNVDPDAERLLSVAGPWLQAINVKRVVMMGDQVYGDLPQYCSLFDRSYFFSVAPDERSSLFDCSRSEVHRLYQQRHRIFWSGEAIRKLQATFPCSMIPDDHEIFDNFGSAPEHHSEKYRNIAAGALDAYFDYQGSRTFGQRQRPKNFHHSFEYGTLATFVLDLRSERTATEEEIRVYSDEQHEQLLRFLSAHRLHHVVCVVVSVPFLHVPDWLAQLGVTFASNDGDLSDRWSHPKAQACRDRLLAALKAHQIACPKQRLVILGGDVHIGMVGKLDWGEGIAPSYQLVSSAFSNSLGAPMRQLVKLVNYREPITIDEDGLCVEATFLDNAAPDAETKTSGNPYGGLNMGIVEVRRLTDDESSVRLLLVGCTQDGPAECKVVFDSGCL